MKNSAPFTLVILVILLLLSGQNPVWADQTKIIDEAEFMYLDSNDFYFHRGSYFDRLQLTSSKAFIWYSFQPADQNPENKPVFIIFNGGPYSATSCGLWSMYTSRYTINKGGDSFIPNPVSWTRLGNLLYIDARTTGFSYNKTINPEDYNLRFKEFNAQNFNMYVDAADFIRVLLKFLSSNPLLQSNPVYIVGESYGGIRATVMLHILLNYQDYGDGTEIYQDANLVELIRNHYDVVFPDYTGQKVPAQVIAQQFSHQILIQSAISMANQREISGRMWEEEGSVLYKIAQEEGIVYQPCDPEDGSCNGYSNGIAFVRDVAGRDPYMYKNSDGWLLGFFDKAGKLLRYSENLQKMTGVNIRGINGMYASTRRSEAYKVRDLDHPDEWMWNPMLFPIEFRMAYSQALLNKNLKQAGIGDLEVIFGILPGWDRYFLPINYDSISAQYWNVAVELGYDIPYSSPRCGRMFLKNMAHVNTLITNAKYDLVVYAPAIPQSLARHDEILESAVHDNQGETPTHRIGKIILTYQSGAFSDIPNLNTRVILFPLYSESCHAVSLTQGSDLFFDLSQWLLKTPSNGNKGE